MSGCLLMQVLKEEIREMIFDSALTEFNGKGFKEASMRSIAEKSGMTVGNLYRYYKNKEDLFYAVISPAFNKVINIIKDTEKTSLVQSKTLNQLLEEIISKIVDVHRDHKDALMILLYGSKGTPYEQAREQITALIEKNIKILFIEKLQASGYPVDEFFAHVLAVSHLAAIETVLKKCNDEDEIKNLMNTYFLFSLSDMTQRVE